MDDSTAFINASSFQSRAIPDKSSGVDTLKILGSILVNVENTSSDIPYKRDRNLLHYLVLYLFPTRTYFL